MFEIKRTLTPKEAGEAVELVFMARAAGLGLTVSRPLGDSASYDVILESNRRLLRIQVKSVSVRDGNAIASRLRTDAAANDPTRRTQSTSSPPGYAPWMRGTSFHLPS